MILHISDAIHTHAGPRQALPDACLDEDRKPQVGRDLRLVRRQPIQGAGISGNMNNKPECF